MAEPREHAFEISRPYCLRCFATIADDGARCEACGHVARGDDRERFWTVHPALVLVASILRTVAALSVPTLWIVWAALGGAFGPMGRSDAEAEGLFPVLMLVTVLSVPAYWTFGKLVRRHPEVDLIGFWAVILLATAAALAQYHLAVAALFASGALIVALAGRAARRWKERLIVAGRPR
jgi:hypothetical protein